jgi:hypothetical protein
VRVVRPPLCWRTTADYENLANSFREQLDWAWRSVGELFSDILIPKFNSGKYLCAASEDGQLRHPREKWPSWQKTGKTRENDASLASTGRSGPRNGGEFQAAVRSNHPPSKQNSGNLRRMIFFSRFQSRLTWGFDRPMCRAVTRSGIPRLLSSQSHARFSSSRLRTACKR